MRLARLAHAPCAREAIARLCEFAYLCSAFLMQCYATRRTPPEGIRRLTRHKVLFRKLQIRGVLDAN